MINNEALKAYVDESSKKILKSAALGSKTAKMLTIQTGVKSASALQILSGTVELSSSPCEFVEGGTTKLSQREIKVNPVTYYESFCQEDLMPYWTQFAVRTAEPGLGQFEREFIDLKMGLINRAIEQAIWKGDVASESANLKRFDGFLKLMKADNTIIKATGADVEAAVKAVYMAIPARVLEAGNPVILMGIDKFREYQMALVEKNMYHFSGAQVSDVFEIIMPGTSTKVIGVPGLDGTNEIVAASLDNLYIGVDMESDFDSFRFWFSDDAQKHKMSVKFRCGVQYAFGDEIVLGTIGGASGASRSRA